MRDMCTKVIERHLHLEDQDLKKKNLTRTGKTSEKTESYSSESGVGTATGSSKGDKAHMPTISQLILPTWISAKDCTKSIRRQMQSKQGTVPQKAD